MLLNDSKDIDFKIPIGSIGGPSGVASSSASIVTDILDGTDTSFDLLGSTGESATSGKRKRKRKRKKKSDGVISAAIANTPLPIANTVQPKRNEDSYRPNSMEEPKRNAHIR